MRRKRDFVSQNYYLIMTISGPFWSLLSAMNAPFMDTIRNGLAQWGRGAYTTGPLYCTHTITPCLSRWGQDEDQLGPLNTSPKGLNQVIWTYSHDIWRIRRWSRKAKSVIWTFQKDGMSSFMAYLDPFGNGPNSARTIMASALIPSTSPCPYGEGHYMGGMTRSDGREV